MPTPDQRLYLPALTEYRAAATKRRAAAFCDVMDSVLGEEVKPLTPAIFSMLLATGNAFVCGGRISERDLREFVLFSSPHYITPGKPGWKRAKARALRGLNFELHQPWRRWVGLQRDPNRAAAVFQIAASEIKAIIDEAFADAPAASARPSRAIATMEAFLIHEFATAYQWPPERTRNTPIKTLMQLHRCIRTARGVEVDDEGENRILTAHLKAKNEALASERALKAENQNHG